MATVRCPECGERVKVRDDGKRLRCPECGESFRPDEDEQPEEPPRRSQRKAKKKSRKLPYYLGGAFLTVIAIVAVVVIVCERGKKDDTDPNSPPREQAKVTLDNFKKVQPGMDLPEVERILGGSVSSSENDMRDVHRKALGEVGAGFETAWARMSEGATWRRWEGKNLRVWVVFAKTRGGAQAAAYSTALEDAGGRSIPHNGIQTFAGNQDLTKLNEQRKQEQALRDDPKWVRGAKARELLLAEWRQPSADGFHFRENGQMTDFGVTSGDRGQESTYKLLDDKYVEIGFKSPHPNLPIGYMRFEYLVNPDELVLIDASQHPIWALCQHYRMPAKEGTLAYEKVVVPLVNDLRSGDEGKRYQALWHAKRLGKNVPAALPALVELLRHTDANVPGQAVEAIGSMGEAAAPAVPELAALLRDPKTKHPLGVILALGRIGPAAKDALPALREIVKTTDDGQVRTEAEYAIKRIEGKKP